MSSEPTQLELEDWLAQREIFDAPITWKEFLVDGDPTSLTEDEYLVAMHFVAELASKGWKIVKPTSSREFGWGLCPIEDFRGYPRIVDEYEAERI